MAYFQERDAFICTILPNGNLEVTLADVDAREWLSENLPEEGSDNLFMYGTESYWTNGSFQPFNAGNANPFVGLSDAPCVAECMDVADDGACTISGAAWAFLEYQTHDFCEVILEAGRAEFTRI